MKIILNPIKNISNIFIDRLYGFKCFYCACDVNPEKATYLISGYIKRNFTKALSITEHNGIKNTIISMLGYLDATRTSPSLYVCDPCLEFIKNLIRNLTWEKFIVKSIKDNLENNYENYFR